MRPLPGADAAHDRSDRPARAGRASARARGAVARGVPWVARRMIAYKFLDEEGVAPFTGFRWPVGDWVEVDRVDPCSGGIHACRVRDLPIWMAPELWEIEL